jgi:hypothetical protein
VLTGIKVLGTAVLGIVLGLVATNAAVERRVGFNLVRAGPWTSSVTAGSEDADPYIKARLARGAEVPLGLAEGLTFIAASDSKGKPLSGRCDYVVKGSAPPARYWTLTVMTRRGRLIEDAAKRYGFTSAEIVRNANGDFSIEVSPSARPGNWLPVGPTASFVLVLRLYDTPVTATASALNTQSMPTIVRAACA